MEVNDLVTSRRFKGIGCISKINNELAVVEVGLLETKKIPVTALKLVDVSGTRTITFKEFQSRILNDKSELNDVIVGNEFKHYVGIGWLTIREITMDDLKKYPRVIH